MSAQNGIRLLLADVDGTLVTDDKVLTEAAIQAVRELRETGIAFAITSSRPPRGMRMLFEPLAIEGVIAGLNGGVYVNPDLSIIKSYTLDSATAHRTMNLMQDQGLDVWIYTQDEWLIRDRNAAHVAREAWILKFDAKLVASFSDIHLANAVKIVGVSDDFALVAAGEKTLQKALGDKASVARSQNFYLDVTDIQANKGAVVTMLSERLNIPPAQIATIGDMSNDVSMFRRSGFSVAMGNASDEVKAQASAVTLSNENDGFASAVHKFILPQRAISKATLEILPDPESLSRHVADWMLELAHAKAGTFAVALSGGSTPRRLYELLAGPPYRDLFPWSRTHWFWGDERFVPHGDALSNYRMVREALLSRAPIPAANIHPIPTEGVSLQEAAAIYERELKSFYCADQLDPGRPLFDVTLLGLGLDGHIASLFPGSAALTQRERWVQAVIGVKPQTRITLTYPALESSWHVAFLIEGEEKRAIFSRLRRGDADLPATRLHACGELIWFADAVAAGSMP